MIEMLIDLNTITKNKDVGLTMSKDVVNRTYEFKIVNPVTCYYDGEQYGICIMVYDNDSYKGFFIDGEFAEDFKILCLVLGLLKVKSIDVGMCEDVHTYTNGNNDTGEEQFELIETIEHRVVNHQPIPMYAYKYEAPIVKCEYCGKVIKLNNDY